MRKTAALINFTLKINQSLILVAVKILYGQSAFIKVERNRIPKKQYPYDNL